MIAICIKMRQTFKGSTDFLKLKRRKNWRAGDRKERNYSSNMNSLRANN
jgi:hypothetical protein